MRWRRSKPARSAARPGIALVCAAAGALVLLAAGASLADDRAAAVSATGAAAAARQEAAPVEVRATAEPASVTIGTPFRYLVEVIAAPGTEIVISQPSAKIGDFDIVDFGDSPPLERDGKTVVTRWYRLVGYQVGDHLVSSPPVLYRLPGEDLTDAPDDEILVSVESLLAKTADATDIRDIKGPMAPPFDWRPYYLGAGVLAALLLAGFVLHRTLNRPRRGLAPPPPRPAHEIAHNELDRLRYRKLVEQGAFKEYYSILSAIVRAYLERRFELRAPEMTTEEFLARSARDGRLQSGHRLLLGEFLSESDLVKFARHLPTIAQSERAFAAAKRFVDETAAGPEAAPAPAADARQRATPPAPAPREERRAAG